LRLILLLAAVVILSGCETAKFYTQAAHGQYEVLSNRRSCDKLIADARTSTELKGKLILAGQICNFAEFELKLPARGDYRRYADIGRRFVVWNVSATPEFSLEAKTWWYPMIGRQDYRGYFSEDAAHAAAGQLMKNQYDACVEGVEAYSTLGFFSDPLLNTFIGHGEASLAEILFHEIAHQQVFAPGDTDFNEAFATTVGQEGVRRWLRAQKKDTSLARYEIGLRRNLQFVHLVGDTRKKLETLYGDERTASGKIKAGKGDKHRISSEELRQEKDRVFDELRAGYMRLKNDWDGDDSYDEWFARDLNNAKLNSVATYYDLVPAFERLLAAYQGNLAQFYSAAKRLSRLPKAERRRRLESFLRRDVSAATSTSGDELGSREKSK
jgi:predicted aminopeptidase